MTQRAIQTLLCSEPNRYFDIVIVESNQNASKQGFIYNMHTPGSHVDTIIPGEPFGYNKFLNIGLSALDSTYDTPTEWIIIANNDIIFTQKWLTKLFEWQQNNPDVLSLSPWEPNWHVKRGLDPDHGPYIGYRTSFEITGWCLIIHRSVIKQCNLFDPQFEFWYQDNDYALTLEHAKIKHALIPQSRVYHMISASHDTIDETERHKMTDGQLNILKQKWNIK